MRTMKKNIKYLFAALLVMGFMTSCSSEEDIAKQQETCQSGQITITAEDFGANQEITRAVETNTALVPINNDIEAEVSVQPDRPSATRATAISDGHYTIYALNNLGNRITGTNKLLKGTVSGGVFTADPGYHLSLSPDTYTFVCFNDAVTDNGSQLTVAKANFSKALIGTKTETITGDNYDISFSMKHVVGRVRVELIAYVPIKATTTAAIAQTPNTAVTQLHFNIDGTPLANATTTVVDDALSFPATSRKFPKDIPIKTMSSISNEYGYYQPGQTVANLQVKLTGGTAYRKLLSGVLSLPSSTVHIARNGSYTIKVTLLPRYKYLFSDGTTDILANKGARKPIALVVRDNNGTPHSGLAFALNKANHGNVVKWRDPGTYSADNTHQRIVTAKDGANDMNGYNITWNAAYDTSGKIKGNEKTLFPAFYYAGHYDEELAAQGVPITGSNIGKWYLGSMGEWFEMLKVLGYVDEFEDAYEESYNGRVYVYTPSPIIKRAFKSAGGELTDDSHWTALEAWVSNWFYSYAWFMGVSINSGSYTYPYAFSKDADTYSDKYAQAFVNF